MFVKNEQDDGELTSTVIERVNTLGYKVSEMQEFMNKVNKTKIAPEIKNMKIASSFTEWTFKKVIREIEDAIEQEAPVKHRKIANNADKRLEDDRQIQPLLNAHGIEDSQYFEYPLPIQVQSGDNFTTNKFTSESDDSLITSDVVYINICGKYSDMMSMASRTLIFNPSKTQKEAYTLAFDAQKHLISLLTPGTALDAAYSQTVEFIKSKNSSLAGKVHSNFGFGIGNKYKEELLSINASNSTKVQEGMVFHVRITFRDVEQQKSKGPIAIGDTVVVDSDGTA